MGRWVRARRLSHGRAHSVKHLGLHRLEVAALEGAGRGFVSAAAKQPGQFIAVHFGRTTAEAELESSGGLLHQNHGHLGAGNSQRQVNHVFGVRRQRPGLFEILAQGGGVREQLAQRDFANRTGDAQFKVGQDFVDRCIEFERRTNFVSALAYATPKRIRRPIQAPRRDIVKQQTK